MAKNARIEELIAEGEVQGYHKGYLCRTRDPWYIVEKISVPDILIGPMGKETFRVVVNTVGATPTNTLYGLRLNRRRSGGITEEIGALASWLRSDSGQDAMRVAARSHHGDGLVKLEPGALKQVMVPWTVANLLMG
ncbi:hypothetical protein Val02_85480 [Virgisporangium aliadipatigenens]|uniref:Type II methyltransferase M.Eco57I C-terminal domain-containing protein n=2 Tax=Virgisporangium aliadipatigenens TaxID=741659 RepID=A0A8J3YVY7_9ACTN|nr:hypothetical protein Val02_85480 [Virgisporangium aliadipatigenens]